MRPRPTYPAPPPRRADVEARLVPSLQAHHDRLDRLARLHDPVPDEPVTPSPAGWFAWFAAPAAPTAEERLRATWRRAVVLRDRAQLAAAEHDALTAQLRALAAWRDVLQRCHALARAEPDQQPEAEAFEAAAHLVDDIHGAIGVTEPLLRRLVDVLSAAADREEVAAVVAEDDVRRGAAHAARSVADGLDLGDVVERLRACDVDRAAFARTLADRLPLDAGHGRDWDRAYAELGRAEDPVGDWLARRSS